MSRHILTTILIVFLFSSCNHNNSSENVKEHKVDTILQNETINDDNSENEFDESDYRVCYSNFPEGLEEELVSGSNREKGFVGIFKGQKIFYEFWSFPNGNYLNVNYLFLRTDTSKIDNFDFCLPEEDLDNSNIVCKRLDSINEEWKIAPTLTIDKIPTFIQPLIIALNGWQKLSGLNGSDKDSPKISINDDKLFLQYWDFDQENAWLIKQTYNHNGQKFTIYKTDTLQSEKTK
ncbi:MAG: hypothetical protein U0U66_10520 [Cytophagaceae bacterium]